MVNNEKCLICNSDAINHRYNQEYNSDEIDCLKCGKYYRVHGFEVDLELEADKSAFYKVSSWIREQNDEYHTVPKIDNEKFNEILEMRDKTIQEKFDLMMLFLKNSPELIEYQDSNSYRITYEHTGSDIDYELIKYLDDILIKSWMKDYFELFKYSQKGIEKNYINGRNENNIDIFSFNNLTFDGLQYLESLDQPNKSSKNIFVAFNFSDELNAIFNTYVKEAIEELGFTYTIVNQSSTDHDKAISDEIIAKLKSSRIIIADFTNHRNSVYFEAGFAMGMKIPIIWTCKKGHIDELSFDTRQYPHLVWRDGEDLKKQISDRIQVII